MFDHIPIAALVLLTATFLCACDDAPKQRPGEPDAPDTGTSVADATLDTAADATVESDVDVGQMDAELPDVVSLDADVQQLDVRPDAGDALEDDAADAELDADSSQPDTVSDTSCSSGCNQPPVAVCPADIQAAPLDVVTLDGSVSSDPDGDPLSHQWTLVSAPGGSTSVPTPADAAITELYVDLAGDYTLELRVDDGELTATCTVSVHAIPPQDLHVQLIWQEDDGDLDLHLSEADANPVGAFFTFATDGSGQDCWWNPLQLATSWGATLDIDDTDGYGPENVNIAADPATGVYTVGVHLYCDQGIVADAFVGTSGPKHARVRIYCGGNLVSEIPGPTQWREIDTTDDFWLVAEVDWSSAAAGGCTVTTLDSIEGAVKYYTAAGVRSAGHLSADCGNHRSNCSSDTDCRAWETCSGGICRINDLCSVAADCTDAATPYCPDRYNVCSRVP